MSGFNMSEYSVLQELGGTSKPLKIMHKKTKKCFVLKKYSNLDRMMNEYYANRIYKVAGAPVPEMHAFPNQKQLLMEWIDGVLLKEFLTRSNHGRIEELKKSFSRFFIVDCLIANWDVVGLYNDNVIVDNNDVAYRVDLGGCMSYRAMGERKKQGEWSEFVSELIFLKDYSMNQNAAAMFSKIVTSEFLRVQFLRLRDQVKLISKIKEIKGLPKNDQQTIERRWNYISSSITYQKNQQPQRQIQSQPQRNTNNFNFQQNFGTGNSFGGFNGRSEEDDIQEAIRRSLLEK